MLRHRVTQQGVHRGAPCGEAVQRLGRPPGRRARTACCARAADRVTDRHRHLRREGSEKAGRRALAAQGRTLLVVDPGEGDEDLVGDVTEILTSLCARLYGRRSAADRASKAIAALERAS
jgi:predicted site-specific integrase-resolvase